MVTSTHKFVSSTEPIEVFNATLLWAWRLFPFIRIILIKLDLSFNVIQVDMKAGTTKKVLTTI
ncbi:hypothetical protein [Phyllobacterium sp. SB3]|uniref:hypothetical protein n=1 Tax=Phyllobacterium sp. SB3 TaxID=3156073 RepID=UPI0032AE8B94